MQISSITTCGTRATKMLLETTLPSVRRLDGRVDFFLAPSFALPIVLNSGLCSHANIESATRYWIVTKSQVNRADQVTSSVHVIVTTSAWSAVWKNHIDIASVSIILQQKSNSFSALLYGSPSIRNRMPPQDKSIRALVLIRSQYEPA